MPELATMMSSLPKSVAICWMARSMSGWFRTSAWYAAARTPLAEAISAAMVAACLDVL